MLRVLGVLLATVSVAGCGSLPPPPSSSLAAALPKIIGGQPVHYVELPASEMDGQLIFFQRPIGTVGGNLDTARVAIGMTRDGLTLTALRVPGADGTQLIEPMITAADFQATARVTAVVGGKNVEVLTLPPATPDRAYLYAWSDTVVVLTTWQPALADEVLRSLP